MNEDSLAVNTADEQVAFTNRIASWLANAGVDDLDRRATLAVGLADVVHASRVAAVDLMGMLQEDLSVQNSADRASQRAGRISAYLFGELKDHLLAIEALWEEEIEVRLAARGTLKPDDE
jgi:hypothetical protein